MPETDRLAEGEREALATAILRSWNRPEHGCDGTEDACIATCPVPRHAVLTLDGLAEDAEAAVERILAARRAELVKPPPDDALDDLVTLIRDAERGGCGAHEGCRDLVRKKQWDAARRWFLGRAALADHTAAGDRGEGSEAKATAVATDTEGER